MRSFSVPCSLSILLLLFLAFIDGTLLYGLQKPLVPFTPRFPSSFTIALGYDLSPSVNTSCGLSVVAFFAFFPDSELVCPLLYQNDSWKGVHYRV